jgi:hypothetical protein
MATTADKQAILAGGDANLAELMRRMSRAEGSSIYEQGGIVLVGARHPNPGPYRNAAIVTRDGMTAEHAIGVATDFFASRQRGFVLWVREHGDIDSELDAFARERGYRQLEEGGLPQLWREGPPDPVDPGEGVTLTFATDEQTCRDFVQVNADAWGLDGVPFETAAKLLFDPQMLDDPSGTTVSLVAYLDGKPASTCMAIADPPWLVGGYWGATAPWALGHRLHDLTTRTAYNEAFARWPQAKVAVCQNSPGAAKNIARMGFEQISRYTRYLVPKP